MGPCDIKEEDEEEREDGEYVVHSLVGMHLEVFRTAIYLRQQSIVAWQITVFYSDDEDSCSERGFEQDIAIQSRQKAPCVAFLRRKNECRRFESSYEAAGSGKTKSNGRRATSQVTFWRNRNHTLVKDMAGIRLRSRWRVVRVECQCKSYK